MVRVHPRCGLDELQRGEFGPGVTTLTQPKVPEAKIRQSQKGFQWIILSLERVPVFGRATRPVPPPDGRLCPYHSESPAVASASECQRRRPQAATMLGMFAMVFAKEAATGRRTP